MVGRIQKVYIKGDKGDPGIPGRKGPPGLGIRDFAYESCKYQLLPQAIAAFNPAATSAADWDGAVAGAAWTADAAAHVRLLNQSTGVIYTLTTTTTCTATGETAIFGARLVVTASSNSPTYRDTAADGAATAVFELVNTGILRVYPTGTADDGPHIQAILDIEYGPCGARRELHFVGDFVVITPIWLQSLVAGSRQGTGSLNYNDVRMFLPASSSIRQDMVVDSGGNGPNILFNSYAPISASTTVTSAYAAGTALIHVASTAGITADMNLWVEHVNGDARIVLAYPIATVDAGTGNIVLRQALATSCANGSVVKAFHPMTGFHLHGSGRIFGTGDRFGEFMRCSRCLVEGVQLEPNGQCMAWSYDTGGRQNKYDSVRVLQTWGATVHSGLALEGQIDSHGENCVVEGSDFEALNLNASYQSGWVRCGVTFCTQAAFMPRNGYGNEPMGCIDCFIDDCWVEDSTCAVMPKDGTHGLRVSLKASRCTYGLIMPGTSIANPLGASGEVESLAAPYNLNFRELYFVDCVHPIYDESGSAGNNIARLYTEHSTDHATIGQPIWDAKAATEWSVGTWNFLESAIQSVGGLIKFTGAAKIQIGDLIGSMTAVSGSCIGFYFTAGGSARLNVRHLRLAGNLGTYGSLCTSDNTSITPRVRIEYSDTSACTIYQLYVMSTHGVFRQGTIVGTFGAASTGQCNVGQVQATEAVAKAVALEDMSALDVPVLTPVSNSGSRDHYVTITAGVGFSVTGVTGNTNAFQYRV
jgi:hypothetical protein